jgi:predicted nucleic acid-binding protein
MRDRPFDGRRYLMDKSAAARSGHEAVREEWEAAARVSQLVVSPPFLLEQLYSARDADEVAALELGFAAFPQAQVGGGTWRTALGAMRDLAAQGAGRHRVKLVDALIAAAAQENALGVIHYDAHYDRLATVLSFESRWLAPPGSL